MKFYKEIFFYIITLLVIIGYGASLYILKRTGTLSGPDFVSNSTIFVGWIVALLIAWIHLQKTRKDNQALKKEEIKKALEINAFREINKGISGFSSALSGLAVTYLMLPGKLKLHIEDPRVFKFNKIEVDIELTKQAASIYSEEVNFLLPIEANEIAVIELGHYRKYIQFRVDDIAKLIRQFIDYFRKTPLNTLITKEGHDEFERKSNEVHESLMDIQSYLFDYRTELMNSFLASTFDKKVPERKPRDPKYKTLKEVAIKEEVEKEADERGLRAMRKI